MRNWMTVITIAIATAGALALAGTATAQQKGEIVVGDQCDRTGATQIVGIRLCAAVQDYINLINSKGGVEGYKIKADEIDHEYKVPQGMEAYERAKKDGAVSYMIYGTPHAQALNQKLVEDKIPGTSPGFGISASADGARYPYLFPIAEDLQKTEGYELRTFAVPPPGVEMGAQVLDITQRYRPDFVIDHLFGRSPSVAIKEYKRAGFPLSKVMGLVWASAEADIEAAGGWAVAEGYHTMSFAGE